jgi:hypothetical protein
LALFLARSCSISATEKPPLAADKPRVSNEGGSPLSSCIPDASRCSFALGGFRCRFLLLCPRPFGKSLSGPNTRVDEKPPGGAGHELGRSSNISVDKATRINTRAVVPFLPYLSLATFRRGVLQNLQVIFPKSGVPSSCEISSGGGLGISCDRLMTARLAVCLSSKHTLQLRSANHST